VTLGIDVGGTKVLGLAVDSTGNVLSDVRVPTPGMHHQQAPEDAREQLLDAMTSVALQLADSVKPALDSPPSSVGIGVPGLVDDAGVLRFAPNLPVGTGLDIAKLLSERLRGSRVVVDNDSTCATVGEWTYGAAVGATDLVMVTLGTGIGAALFVDGLLVPNLEFGHIEIDGVVAEDRAAARPREVEHLSWAEWAGRLEKYLQRIDALVWPDVILLGGEITVDADRFLPLLAVRPRIVIAQLRNAAGVVGAALAAAGQQTLPQVKVETGAATRP